MENYGLFCKNNFCELQEIISRLILLSSQEMFDLPLNIIPQDWDCGHLPVCRKWRQAAVQRYGRSQTMP